MTPVSDPDPREVFAAELRDIIENQQRDLTQRGIADYVGVSQQTVSGWLRAKTIPEPDVLEKLAELLGADSDRWLKLKIGALRETSARRRRPEPATSPRPGAGDGHQPDDSDLDALALASGLDPHSFDAGEKAMLQTVFAGIRAKREHS